MRPIKSSEKTAPLASKEQKQVLERHLPYRLYHLLNALDRVPARTAEDNQAFEAGAVAGRVLLEFLGVGLNLKTGELRESRAHIDVGDGLTDDVKVVDVGGTYVSLSDLSDAEKQIIREFIRGVHKACAHLTLGSEHNLTVDVFKAAGPIIFRLYRKHVPPVALPAPTTWRVPELDLIVLRSPDPDRAAAFYSRLGLQFTKHQHGTGPFHFAAELGGCVFEIYPLSANSPSTLGTRIGFKVASLDSALAALRDIPETVISPAKDSEWGRRAVITDPDGHRVELTEA